MNQSPAAARGILLSHTHPRLYSIFFLPLSSSLEHASKLHSVALIHILFSTCIRGTLLRIQIPYRHGHPSPTCLVRMAPTFTNGSSVSLLSTIQRNIPQYNFLYITLSCSHNPLRRSPRSGLPKSCLGNPLNSIKLKL